MVLPTRSLSHAAGTGLASASLAAVLVLFWPVWLAIKFKRAVF